MMEQETTDPLAARLLQDIISDMEAELKELIDLSLSATSGPVREAVTN
jgi:hypothetical protein